MSQLNEQSPLSATRRERLASILAEWPEGDPPPATEEVPRFVALISEGSPESPSARAPMLVFAEDRTGLAERLRVELADGRLAHGRLWDLDAAFYPWGNLAIAYEVRIGEELIRPVHAVSVEGDGGGLYLFADRLDAEAFCRVVRRRDGRAHVTETELHDNSAADRLIDAERDGCAPR